MNNIESVQKQFGDHLFNFVKSKVSSVHDAEDIYQDVIYKIATKGDQLSNETSLKSWLFTIARNQIVDFYRGRKDAVDIETVAAVNSLKQENDSSAYHEIEPCLKSFIDALPNDYRDVIQLSEIEGLSQKALASNLGMNYVTLRSKVQRGRDKIRKMIFDACIIQQDKNGRVIDCSPNPKNQGCGAESSSESCRS